MPWLLSFSSPRLLVGTQHHPQIAWKENNSRSFELPTRSDTHGLPRISPSAQPLVLPGCILFQQVPVEQSSNSGSTHLPSGHTSAALQLLMPSHIRPAHHTSPHIPAAPCVFSSCFWEDFPLQEFLTRASLKQPHPSIVSWISLTRCEMRLRETLPGREFPRDRHGKAAALSALS